MTNNDQIQQDLDYVMGAVRQNEQPLGEPAIYFLWAALVAVGFSLPDFAPQKAGLYWLIAGVGGGVLSSWLGMRAQRRRGVRDRRLGRRYTLHWSIGGLAFLLTGLPMMLQQVSPQQGGSTFLFTAGVVYALAGVHLERPLLWMGLAMLGAYAALLLFALPYTWTITGLVIALALTWAGLATQRLIARHGRG